MIGDNLYILILVVTDKYQLTYNVKDYSGCQQASEKPGSWFLQRYFLPAVGLPGQDLADSSSIWLEHLILFHPDRSMCLQQWNFDHIIYVY